MRYYAVEITNPKTGEEVFLSSLGFRLTSLLPQSSQNPIYGQTNPAALNIEIDIGTSNQTDPDSNGAYLRVWGVGIEDLKHSKDFNGLDIKISGGMAKGLPLANPMQAGVLLTGTINQAFGNWVGTEQTLDFIIVPGSTSDPGGAIYNAQGNFPFNWQAGTSLAAAIRQTLSIALPGVALEISINENLVTNYAQTGHYRTLQQFADFINGLSKPIIGGDYQGVVISISGNTVSVFDGTALQLSTKAIAFTDLIGQPTWIGPGVISVKTVMRADLQVGNVVSLPRTIVSTSGAAMPAYPDQPGRYDISFGGGVFFVQQVHHYGNFRQGTADAWNSTYQMYPADLGTQAEEIST